MATSFQWNVPSMMIPDFHSNQFPSLMRIQKESSPDVAAETRAKKWYRPVRTVCITKRIRFEGTSAGVPDLISLVLTTYEPPEAVVSDSMVQLAPT